MTPDELILGEIKERLRVQLTEIESLDTKGSILLSTDAIILAALFAVAFTTKLERPLVTLLLVLGVVFLLGSFLVALLAYGVKEYNYPPEPAPLIEKYGNRPVEETRQVLAATFAAAFKLNEAKTREKAQRLRWAIRLLFFGIIALSGGYLVLLLT